MGDKTKGKRYAGEARALESVFDAGAASCRAKTSFRQMLRLRAPRTPVGFRIHSAFRVLVLLRDEHTTGLATLGALIPERIGIHSRHSQWNWF
jgi:hypothetical protein